MDDPLDWNDSKPYKQRLKEARKKTNQVIKQGGLSESIHSWTHFS